MTEQSYAAYQAATGASADVMQAIRSGHFIDGARHPRGRAEQIIVSTISLVARNADGSQLIDMTSPEKTASFLRTTRLGAEELRRLFEASPDLGDILKDSLDRLARCASAVYNDLGYPRAFRDAVCTIAGMMPDMAPDRFDGALQDRLRADKRTLVADESARPVPVSRSPLAPVVS